jgi:hypothetical protein
MIYVCEPELGGRELEYLTQARRGRELHLGLLNFYSLKRLFVKNKLKICRIFFDELHIPLLSKLIKRRGIPLLRNDFYSIFAANLTIGFKKD